MLKPSNLIYCTHRLCNSHSTWIPRSKQTKWASNTPSSIICKQLPAYVFRYTTTTSSKFLREKWPVAEVLRSRWLDRPDEIPHSTCALCQPTLRGSGRSAPDALRNCLHKRLIDKSHREAYEISIARLFWYNTMLRLPDLHGCAVHMFARVWGTIGFSVESFGGASWSKSRCDTRFLGSSPKMLLAGLRSLFVQIDILTRSVRSWLMSERYIAILQSWTYTNWIPDL